MKLGLSRPDRFLSLSLSELSKEEPVMVVERGETEISKHEICV